jgi:hypothetical protein
LSSIGHGQHGQGNGQGNSKSNGHGNGNGHDKAGRAEKPGEEDELGNSLRKYLYEKYVYRNNGGPRPSLEVESHHEG